MKQSIPRFLLFFTLLSIYSCTLTKRKYTGGYYVHWHSKTPEAGAINPVKKTLGTTNKIAQTNSSLVKTEVALQHGKSVYRQIVQANTFLKNKRESHENISDNATPSTYSAMPENGVPGHNQPKNDTSRRDVTLSWLLCLIGLVAGFILLIVAFALSFTTDSPALAILMVPPIILFIISMVHSFKAMKGGHNWGLLIIILLDILFALFLAFVFIGLLFPML